MTIKVFTQSKINDLVSLLDIGSAEGLKEYRRLAILYPGNPDRQVWPRENRKLSEMYID